MSYHGLFRPKHPEKYQGDPNNIVFRSLWERKFFLYCDSTKNVLTWASEEFYIPYVSPVDGKLHRYFPDVWMEVRTSTGTKAFLVEIKPKKQSKPPEQPKRKGKRYLREAMNYAVNQAKWQAAQEFCRTKGWTFMVVTEKELFGKQ